MVQSSGPPRFGSEANTRIDHFLSRYPTRQAALLPTLTLAEQEFGCLSDEVLELVASRLGLPPICAHEAATFYTLYHRKPKGRHCVYVCTGIGCFLKGSDRLLEHLKKKLGIDVGETTPNGEFTLHEVECLADCDHGPMAQIDGDDHHDLSFERVDQILETLP